jgi:hypothetical protein
MGEDLQTTGAETHEDLEPEFTLDELMDEIYREFHTPELGRGEFTIRMYAERQRLGLSSATREIELAVKAGRLEAAGDRRMADGKRAAAYRIASA